MSQEATKYKYTQEELSEITILSPLSKKQETYLNDSENDIIVWGGAAASGKSFISALDILINGYDDSDFRAGIIRKTKEQLKGAGALYDECVQMYSKFNVKPKGNELSFHFPEGAIVRMGYLDKPADKHNYQGWQVTRFLVDEAQQLCEEGIAYLLSRLRSKSKQKHQLKLTCNPDYDSFLRVWLEKAGYLDEKGFPLKERDGKTVYFAEIAGETVFEQTLESFEEKYGKGDDAIADPLKFVYYSANVYDNPWVVKYKKDYLKKLENLKQIEKERLLLGCWYSRAMASGMFKREWVTIIDKTDVPIQSKKVRAWDRAGTLPSTSYPDPDWTVGIKGCLDDVGNLYIIDMVRFRDRPAKVQMTIEDTAKRDGGYTLVAIPQDPGASGKEAADYSRAKLLKQGATVRVVKARKAKELRFEPVAIAAQNRNIFVVKGDWNNAFFEELEQLDFTTNKTHDDIADALSDLYSTLLSKTFVPHIKINSSRQPQANTLIN